MKWKSLALLAGGLAVAAALFVFLWRTRPQQDQALQTSFAGIVEDYRKIIVLMDGAENLDDATHARCFATGQVIFWRKQRALRDVAARLSERDGHEARVEQ